MGQRVQPITRFQSGQSTNEHTGDVERVPVKFKMSQRRNIGQPDPLSQALTSPPRVLSDTQRFAGRGGKPYKPHWSKLSERGGMGSLATGMGRHTSAPGTNALGRPSGGRGEKSGYPR